MRFALFCDGAYCEAKVAIAAVHALETIVEAEVERVVAAVVVVVRRRTPTVAVVTLKVKR